MPAPHNHNDLIDLAVQALAAGDRTRHQIAARLGIDPTPILDYRDEAELERTAPAPDLDVALNGLTPRGLACMRVVDGEWRYTLTKKGRARAAEIAAAEAVTGDAA
ncbi:hypothetical protein [Winogradskya consettensis]|nr:hypothetical protein [Actinoplanes consettensis]